jgi:hypothetical protein
VKSASLLADEGGREAPLLKKNVGGTSSRA